MSFRKPQTIKTRTAGTYVDGVWVEGSETIVVIQASVQPLSLEDMQSQTEGRRTSDSVKMYTDSDLKAVEDKGANQQPDILVWRGREYEIVSKGVYQMGVVPHFKFICSISETQ